MPTACASAGRRDRTARDAVTTSEFYTNSHRVALPWNSPGVASTAITLRGRTAKIWPHVEHRLRLQVPLVLWIVGLDEAADRRGVGNLPGDAFERDRLDAVFRAYDAIRIRREIARLARLRAAAEVEGVVVVEPDAPDRHAMGRAVGAGRRDPVVARARQPLDRPSPRQQSAPAVGVEDSIARHVGPARFDFHAGYDLIARSFRATEKNCARREAGAYSGTIPDAPPGPALAQRSRPKKRKRTNSR